MQTSPFNVVDANNAIHSMPHIGFNCGIDRKGHRIWATPKGRPIARTNCAQEILAAGWLYPMFEENFFQALAIYGGQSNAGFWYPVRWALENDNFNYDTSNLSEFDHVIPKGDLIGVSFSTLDHDHPKINGGLDETPWLDPASLSELDPQYPENAYPPVYRDKVKFQIILEPYCERMVVAQNVYFDVVNGQFVCGYGDFTPIWHSPRKESNRTNKDFMLRHAECRPYKPSEYGIPPFKSAAIWNPQTEEFEIENYADWTWTPKRNWQGGGVGYHEQDQDHIFNMTQDDVRSDYPDLDLRFLYELPNIYWDKVSDGQPEHWDWQIWANNLLKYNDNSGPGWAWNRWEGEDFWKGWDDAGELFKRIPAKTAVDARVEVLTYHWKMKQKSSYTYTDPVHGWKEQRETDWTMVSWNNYWNSRTWTTFRQIAPVKGIDWILNQ